jgi:hypothetical protein
LVGSYVYKSQDPEGKASDHEWDRLTLQGDGKYDLVQGGPTKAKSEKTGFWTFTGGDPAQVMLDHAGYPALVKGPFLGTDGISPDERRVRISADPRQRVSSLDA